MMMMQRQALTLLLLATCLIYSCLAFCVPSAQQETTSSRTLEQSTHHRSPILTPLQRQGSTPQQSLLYARDNDDYYDERERVRVPRGGRRRRSFNNDDEERQERRYYDEANDDEYYDEEEEYEDDEFDVDYEFNRVELDEEYASDILIPNPIIDNIDPDGAGERFGEIAKDPTFWRDLILVIAVFNFCEYVAQVPYY